MDVVWPILIPVLFILSLFLFFGLTLFGLPGNWLMLFACVGYAAFFTASLRAMMGWGTVVAIAVLVLGGEILETMAGAAGVAKGGSKRGALLAILGSIVGSILGGSFGSVIPVFGSIAGVLLGASLGAMAGAMWGEHLEGRDTRFQWEIGKLAFWGRLWGSIGKMVVGAIVIGIALASVLF